MSLWLGVSPGEGGSDIVPPLSSMIDMLCELLKGCGKGKR
jgi:hypothetical protein